AGRGIGFNDKGYILDSLGESRKSSL
ncbi:hypothetical protein VN97_g9219, partial [Penicillium thymicola]